MTFKTLAEQYIEAHEAGWKNSKHAAQWTNTLTQYAYPVLGSMLVADIDTPAVRVLEAEPEKGKGSLWATRTETASRLRGRMEVILDYATTKGLREGPNPARWKGHLALTLPAKRKVAPVEHHAALPVAEMPAFMRTLRAVEGMGARALEFVILTAARSGEVRGMEWTEVDMTAKVWTVPASRMKAGREHRVPLSDAAIARLSLFTSETAAKLLICIGRGPKVSTTRRRLRRAVRCWLAAAWR